MKILLILLTILPSLSLAKDITYFDYKFTIPDEYKVIKDTVVNESNGLFILIKDKKVAFSIEKIKKEGKRFFPLKEYGRVKNHRELFYTLYSDRPSNNEAVLDFRRIDKLYPLQKRSITENDRDFVFFRTDNSMDLLGTTYLISTPINDEVILLDFPDKIEEKFIKSVIDSLDVK